METNTMDKKTRAERKVKELKGFHSHLMMYILLNMMLIVVKIVGTMYNGENFMGPIWHFSTFIIPLFWGIGLALHAMKVFNKNPFFNRDWEKRQIQKYIDEDQQEADKYK